MSLAITQVVAITKNSSSAFGRICNRGDSRIKFERKTKRSQMVFLHLNVLLSVVEVCIKIIY